MRAWKIVEATRDGRMRSISTHCLVDASRTYTLGKWSEAVSGTGLLCFATRRQARAFKRQRRENRCGPDKILRVEVEEQVALPTVRIDTGTVALIYLELLWQRNWSTGLDITPGWPDGTVAYKRVRPERIVR